MLGIVKDVLDKYFVKPHQSINQSINQSIKKQLL